MTDYLSVSSYLKDLYQTVKERCKEDKESYSYRHFSRDLGFGYTNYMHLVCSEKRKPTVESAEDIGKTLELKVTDVEYFKALAELGRAKTTEKSEAALSKLFLIKQKKLSKRKNKYETGTTTDQSKDHMDYLGHWYIPVIREMVVMESFEEDPFWIANNISPRVRATEIRDSLKLLERLGYLSRDDNGKLIQSEKSVQTSKVARNLGVKKFHKEMLDLSRNALQTPKTKKKEFQAMTLPVDKDLAKEFKDEIRNLLGRFMAKSTSLKSPEDVVQLNIQMFSVTDRTDEG